jgi:hypothetical protein
MLTSQQKHWIPKCQNIYLEETMIDFKELCNVIDDELVS